MFNKLRLATVGAAMALGLGASAAHADPQVFQINPDAIPGSTLGSPFLGTFVAGNSSDLLTRTSATTFSGDGYIAFLGFTNAGNPVSPTVSRLLIDYNLYVTFHVAGTVTSGTNLAPGSTYSITTLDFQVFADPGANNTFTQANCVPGGACTPTAISNTAGDIRLASGTIAEPGSASLSPTGGAAINVIDFFSVCTGAGTANTGGTNVADPLCTSGIGDAYFDLPNPFYLLAFSEFNNTGQGVVAGATQTAVTSASGGVDFNIPEPATLAVFGMGLLGLGAAIRRRRKAA